MSQCAGVGGGAALAAGVPGLPGLGGAAAAGAGRHQAPAGHRAGGCQAGEGDSRPDPAQAGGAVGDDVWRRRKRVDVYNLKFEIELPTNYQSDTEIRALSSIPGQRIFDSALLVENYINVLYL